MIPLPGGPDAHLSLINALLQMQTQPQGRFLNPGFHSGIGGVQPRSRFMQPQYQQHPHTPPGLFQQQPQQHNFEDPNLGLSQGPADGSDALSRFVANQGPQRTEGEQHGQLPPGYAPGPVGAMQGAEDEQAVSNLGGLLPRGGGRINATPNMRALVQSLLESTRNPGYSHRGAMQNRFLHNRLGAS